MSVILNLACLSESNVHLHAVLTVLFIQYNTVGVTFDNMQMFPWIFTPSFIPLDNTDDRPRREP